MITSTSMLSMLSLMSTNFIAKIISTTHGLMHLTGQLIANISALRLETTKSYTLTWKRRKLILMVPKQPRTRYGHQTPLNMERIELVFNHRVLLRNVTLRTLSVLLMELIC